MSGKYKHIVKRINMSKFIATDLPIILQDVMSVKQGRSAGRPSLDLAFII